MPQGQAPLLGRRRVFRGVRFLALQDDVVGDQVHETRQHREGDHQGQQGGIVRQGEVLPDGLFIFQVELLFHPFTGARLEKDQRGELFGVLEFVQQTVQPLALGRPVEDFKRGFEVSGELLGDFLKIGVQAMSELVPQDQNLGAFRLLGLG